MIQSQVDRVGGERLSLANECARALGGKRQTALQDEVETNLFTNRL